MPLVCITSYEMMQRLTCDACKGRGGPHTSMCAGQRPPCADPQNCMASLRWQVVIVDGERAGLLRPVGWCGQCAGYRVQLQAGVSRASHTSLALSLLWPTRPAAPNLAAAESHTLRTSSKPPDALHTEAVAAALRLSKRAILLTGTPSLSRPFDLYRQVGCVPSTCIHISTPALCSRQRGTSLSRWSIAK